jgi:NAD(P)-dependent dehydrogenase (short-subunit alcohol dehydrogenase family)
MAMVTPGALFDLSGKTAVVTGGSRGLGREIVLAYAAAGADVAIVSRKLDSCEELADLVTTTTGRKAVPIACHVGHWRALDGMVDTVYSEFGRIDVLVNNAGMAPVYDNLTDVTEELMDKTLDVNLKGPFRLSVLVGTQMVDDGGGSIINLSSTGSLRPRPHIIPYASAKAAQNAMTVGLAFAFGPTVRVNTLMPGPFRTDIAKSWDMDKINARQAEWALQRIGEPHEIVTAALYLASDASSFTTGTTLRVDGGMP